MDRQPEVNLCDEGARLLMFQVLAAGLEIASQEVAASIRLDAMAGLTKKESQYMGWNSKGWVN